MTRRELDGLGSSVRKDRDHSQPSEVRAKRAKRQKSLPFHCHFPATEEKLTSSRKSRNAATCVLPKQRAEGSNPFSRSNRLTRLLPPRHVLGAGRR